MPPSDPFPPGEKRGTYPMPSKASQTVKCPRSSKPGPRIQRQSIYSIGNCSVDSLEPAYKRVTCFAGPNSSTFDNTARTMRQSIPLTMNPTDFENLPPAVRRKYFSSLERLRYAQQQSSIPKPPAQHHLRNLSLTGGKLLKPITRPRQSSDSFRTQRTTSSRPSKFRRQNSTSTDSFLLSQADARWFLELPETIRRKHFSREERIALASKCESIIVDAADETLYRMGQQANKSLNTLDSSLSIMSEHEIPDSRRRSLDSDVFNATQEFRKSFRWMEEDGKLDLQLKEFYNFQNDHVPLRAQSAPRCIQRPQASRRSLSISTPLMTVRGHSSSSSTSNGRPSITSRRTTSCVQTTSNFPSIAQRSCHSADADATYYNDPEARLKLRVYLASPQKFDEAIEFGFPSTAEAKEFFKSRPMAPTLLNDEMSDEEEPYLVRDTEFQGVHDDADSVLIGDIKDQPRARSSGSMSARRSRQVLDHYPHSSPGNREMTLRMTLTRKDLRADESILYGWQEDALALEELPPAADLESPTTPYTPHTKGGEIDWNVIDKESQSGLKKLWRKVIGR